MKNIGMSTESRKRHNEAFNFKILESLRNTNTSWPLYNYCKHLTQNYLSAIYAAAWIPPWQRPNACPKPFAPAFYIKILLTFLLIKQFLCYFDQPWLYKFLNPKQNFLSV